MAPNNDVLPCTAGHLISLSTSVRLAIEALLIYLCSRCKFVQTRCPTIMPIHHVQSRNRTSVRPLGACVGLTEPHPSDYAHALSAYHFLPAVFLPALSLWSSLSARRADHDTSHSFRTSSVFFERIDESYIKALPPHSTADSPFLRMCRSFLGDKAASSSPTGSKFTMC